MSVLVSCALTAGITVVVACGQAVPAGAAAAKSPISIAFIDFETGPNALPDRHNSVLMAVNQINAAGGVDGHKLTIKYYDSGVTTEETVTGVQKAIGDHPTVIIGLEVSSGVQAAASIIKASGIPTLQLASDNSTDADRVGATNLFRPLATVTEEAYGQAKYVGSKHPKSVGIWDDSDLNASTQMKLVQKDLQGMGVKNFTYRESALNPTDTTQQVVDMKGADALISGGFPPAEALFAKQLVQNGITTPLTMSYGAYATIAFKLAPANVLANDNWLSICEPQSSTSKQAKAYVAHYTAAYPTANVVSSAPQAYDAVYAVADAVKEGGGSLSPSSIVKHLSKANFTGACGQYTTDKHHNMIHQVQVVSAGDPTKNLAVYSNLNSN
ncbi:MAG TPA: ABC transporter substrate-binding protein [Acidimicrobiales bacterium]|nr:ABC transporter substrate-binding protein [Acidimicrobiales bacterium]